MIDPPFDPVTLAVPFFVLSVILEIVLARLGVTRSNYEAKDTLASLGMGLGRSLAALVTAGIVFAATVWVWKHRAFTVPFGA